jgi:D-sedoheptulose 7-phosphate isomerase
VLNHWEQYFASESALLAALPFDRLDALLAILEQVRTEGRRVFLFGNGGSASTASHFACDLGKGTIAPGCPRFKVIALDDNMATFSAYANDMGYERVFAEPLISLSERGDVAIGFSVSGNSPNVLRAMEAARARGLKTVGFTGFDGGQLQEQVDVHIHIPSRSFGMVEDIHLAMTHALCERLKLHHE